MLAFVAATAAIPGVGSVPALAAQSLPLSAVQLRGDWAEAQRRDQEVLLSLNVSRLVCHFTSTANLTKCGPSDSLWQTYVKSDANGYEHKLGFLSAGNNFRLPAVLAVDDCMRKCSAESECLGITFQHDDALPTSKVACYWKDRILFTPQKMDGNCVAPGGDDMPLCSPLPGEMGFGQYYGHYQGHWLSATAFLINNTQNATVKARADEVIQIFKDVMDAWKAKYSYDGYLFPYDPLVWDKFLAGFGASPYYTVPFYTWHKLMAGLLDQYTHAGSELAFEMVLKMADWTQRVVEATINAGGEELWQKVLLTEWGGMNDVLYALYQHTGNVMHLTTARRFNGWIWSTPLAEGHDDLAEGDNWKRRHANFHLPEIVGFARAYELTGNATDAAIATNFFNILSTNHSYSTGGSNSAECWQKPRDLGAFLTSQTEESCTQYNVLKVARRLFTWKADPLLADFYERSILNGMIGNQNRQDLGMTSYIYMLPLGAGNGPTGGVMTKPWGKSDYGFPCCWGSLSESFAKLGDSVYFVSPEDNALFVNQFVSSQVQLDQLGVSVEQEADFLTSPTSTTKLTIHTTQTVDLLLKIRVPRWLSLPGSVVLNGEQLRDPVLAGSYFEVNRRWANGDVVEVSFPPSLTTELLNDLHAEYNATVAFMYGPLVLAGVDVDTDIFVPNGNVMQPATFITRTSASELEFEAVAADGKRMRMRPLRDVVLERYAVYFHTAGTKPFQPQQGYCALNEGDGVDVKNVDGDDSPLVSNGAPGPVPLPNEHVRLQIEGASMV